MKIDFAIYPLQWMATPDGGLDFEALPPVDTLLAELKEGGWDAMSIAHFLDKDPDAYLTALERAGVRPAPGFLIGWLDDPDDRGRMHAEAVRLARIHRSLGLTELFVGPMVNFEGPRAARPGAGVELRGDPLGTVATTLTELGKATADFDVTLCLHPHAASVIETEDEIEWLIDRLGPEEISLGLDTGHLAWADIDPAEFVKKHADRVRGLHIKDICSKIAAAARAGNGNGYHDAVTAGIWAEPGRGDLDLNAVIKVLPDDFDGWGIFDIDKSTFPTAVESARACASWAEGHRAGRVQQPVTL